MKTLALALSLLLLLVAIPALAGDSRARDVPAALLAVESSRNHRMLVFQSCSPEHCWNEFFVQELPERGTAQRPTCSAPVTELNSTSDYVLHDASWADRTAAVLELAVISSHGDFEPHTVTLVLGPTCTYSLQPVSPRAANNSFKPNPFHRFVQACPRCSRIGSQMTRYGSA